MMREYIVKRKKISSDYISEWGKFFDYINERFISSFQSARGGVVIYIDAEQLVILKIIFDYMIFEDY